MLSTFFPKRVRLVGIKSFLSVPNTDWFAFSDQTPKPTLKTHSIMRPLDKTGQQDNF